TLVPGPRQRDWTPLGIRAGHQAAKPGGVERADVHVVSVEQSPGDQGGEGCGRQQSNAAASRAGHDRPRTPQGRGNGLAAHAHSAEKGRRVTTWRKWLLALRTSWIQCGKRFPIRRGGRSSTF